MRVLIGLSFFETLQLVWEVDRIRWLQAIARAKGSHCEIDQRRYIFNVRLHRINKTSIIFKFKPLHRISFFTTLSKQSFLECIELKAAEP